MGYRVHMRISSTFSSVTRRAVLFSENQLWICIHQPTFQGWCAIGVWERCQKCINTNDGGCIYANFVHCTNVLWQIPPDTYHMRSGTGPEKREMTGRDVLLARRGSTHERRRAKRRAGPTEVRFPPHLLRGQMGGPRQGGRRNEVEGKDDRCWKVEYK